MAASLAVYADWFEITGFLESRVLQGVWSGRVTRRLICQPLVIDRGLLDLASQRDQVVMAHVIVGPGQVAQGGYNLVALQRVQGCDGSGHAMYLFISEPTQRPTGVLTPLPIWR